MVTNRPTRESDIPRFGWHVRYWVAYNDLIADEKEKIKSKYAAKQQDPPSRVQKSKRICDGDVSRKVAREAAEKHMDEVNGYVPGETILPDLTLADYWDKHYLPWATNNLKPSTLHGYKQAFTQHLKQRFRSTPLKDITTPSATKFLGQLAEDEQGERIISHTKWIGRVCRVRHHTGTARFDSRATGHLSRRFWHIGFTFKGR